MWKRLKVKRLIAIVTITVMFTACSKAETVVVVEEPKFLYRTTLYSVYCFEGYKWLVGGTHVPQQMFRESANGRSVPVDCNR